MRELHFSLTEPQAAFALAEDDFPAIVAGFGSGKTQALCARLLIRKVSFPRGRIGYFAPTYDLIKTFAWPRIEDMLQEHGLPYKTNKNEKLITVAGYGSFLFRTMEDPSRIIGFETADCGVDELDTLKEAHAKAAWDKIIARNRQKKPFGEKNTVGVATTPEGFRFTHSRWKRDAKPGYKLIVASTYSNEHNLEPDYIEKLRALYSPALFQAYINGQFVNLTSGSVYPDFDRDKNGTKEKIRDGESLHIGMDFNIYKMAAVVFVIREGRPYALEEFTKLRDTPTMCEAIRTRFGRRHAITIYPDPAGKAESSKGAGVSDFVLIRQAGFEINAHAAHPAVRNRIAAVNTQILNARGERRFRVNVDACPDYTTTLEQQIYDKGEPDKSAGLDHSGDAGGYCLEKLFPVATNSSARMQISGT